MDKADNQPYWYQAIELSSNKYTRLLYHRFFRSHICLITQHFHLTFGHFTLEMDW